MKARYIVTVRVPFVLEKVIEAESREEAERIARQLDPDEFDNFHSFYEWLGSCWKKIAENFEIEEL